MKTIFLILFSMMAGVMVYLDYTHQDTKIPLANLYVKDVSFLRAGDLPDLKAAAVNGDKVAQFKLGVIYSLGQVEAQNYNEALKWLRASANQNDTKAQNLLALMYARGEGVPQSIDTACLWLTISSKHGDQTAKNYLDWYRIFMGPEKLQAATRRASAWQAASNTPTPSVSVYPLTPAQ